MGVTQADFHQLMAEFLNAVILFLRNKRVRMTCQNTALKYLPTIFPHVCSPDIYSPQELTLVLFFFSHAVSSFLIFALS